MSFNTNIAATCLKFANLLIHPFLNLSLTVLFIFSLLIICSWVVANKLSSLVKPQNPKISLAIRHIAPWITLTAKLLVHLFLIYTFVIFIMVLFGLCFSDGYEIFTPIQISNIAISKIWTVAKKPLITILLGSVTGLMVSLYLSYYKISDWEKGDGLDDVEKIVEEFKSLDIYDASPHFNITKGCFFGKDLEGKSIYIPWAKIRETHIQILGTTGVGKGILSTVIASQCLLKGEGLIWFDPKSDEYAPIILSQEAAKVNKKFHFINLNNDQPAQFNLFTNSNKHEIEELLIAGFELRGKGTDGDFYRGKDQDAASLMAEIAIKENATSIPQLWELCSKVKEIVDQENFWRKFKKLASMSVINTTEGLNLKEAILNGDVIYILGSTDNDKVIMLQKMLLVLAMQIIKSRKGKDRKLPICCFLDEFKYFISFTALTALGVVRSFNSHFILAHQSLGDLADCGGINPEAVYGAVVDNTSIKILYKINDAIHAEKMAKLGGLKKTFVASLTKNEAEKDSFSSGWKEANKFYISPDLITHLPIPSDRTNQASVGIVYGLNNAKVLHVGRLKAEGEMPEINAVNEFHSTGGNNSLEELI